MGFAGLHIIRFGKKIHYGSGFAGLHIIRFYYFQTQKHKFEFDSYPFLTLQVIFFSFTCTADAALVCSIQNYCL